MLWSGLNTITILLMANGKEKEKHLCLHDITYKISYLLHPNIAVAIKDYSTKTWNKI